MPPRDESDGPRHRRESDDGEFGDGFIYDDELDEMVDESPTQQFGEPVFDEELAGLHYDAGGMPLGPRRVLPLEDEPSAMVAKYLFPTEKFRGEWRKHWTYIADRLAYAAGATIVFGLGWGFFAKHHLTGLAVAVIILWLAVMGWIGWRIADWYFDRFILTNKRLMVVNGMITRTVGMMPLGRVTDMKYEQSPIGRLFNYGNFVLESAGQDQALREVKHLPNPNELYLRIVEEMYEPEAVEAKLNARLAAEDDGS